MNPIFFNAAGVTGSTTDKLMPLSELGAKLKAKEAAAPAPTTAQTASNIAQSVISDIFGGSKTPAGTATTEGESVASGNMVTQGKKKPAWIWLALGAGVIGAGFLIIRAINKK